MNPLQLFFKAIMLNSERHLESKFVEFHKARGEMIRLFFALLASSLMGACSSLPKSTDGQDVIPISVSEVQQSPESHLGKAVRWGGSVISVTNKKHHTLVEVLSKPLSRGTRPTDKPGQGRFFLEISGFVDPQSYPINRDITVVGTIDGVQERLIGEFPYRYPVLQSIAVHLWPDDSNDRLYHYDPFYGPFYPGWPHGYRYRHSHPFFW